MLVDIIVQIKNFAVKSLFQQKLIETPLQTF